MTVLRQCQKCGGNPSDRDYGQEYWVECEACGFSPGKFKNRFCADVEWNSPLAPTQGADDAQPVAINEQQLYTDVREFLSAKDSMKVIAAVGNLLATRDAAPIDAWVSASEALPTKPGNYLAMLVEDNSFGYTSTEPVPVEFDAYTSRPKQFTISDSWSNGPENATDEITFWIRLPAPPSAASASMEKAHD